MRGYSGWSYAPYSPLSEMDKYYSIHITHVSHGVDSILIGWIDYTGSNAFEVLYAPLESDNYRRLTAAGYRIAISGLEPDTEYKVLVMAENGAQSAIRRVRTGFVPGSIVNYLHPEDDACSYSGKYLSSPSIVMLQDGGLIAAHDIFAPGHPQNVSVIMRSDSRGKYWRYLTDLMPCFWPTLFMHKDALYAIGVSNEYGDLLIGRSDSEGLGWSTPTVISRGSCFSGEYGIHKGAVPVLRAHGRLWIAIEYGAWQRRGQKGSFASGVYSIDENADLLDAENWQCTGFLQYDPAWPGADEDAVGAIEGNLVLSPEGEVLNILRCGRDKALVLSVDPRRPEALPEFREFINFPMAHSKFVIRRHENGLYYALGNTGELRNVLSLYSSKDLKNWELVKHIIDASYMDKEKIAFQYPDFCFDGDELLVVLRTAFNGAASFHDSNYITFLSTSIYEDYF